MAKRKLIWVYPSGDVWVVKKGGTSKASAIRNTKKEAYDAARNIALNQNLTIKLRDVDRSLKTISPREARDNNCFITTACVKHYGLSDDCYQLNTLRKFRDGYLSKSDANKTLIHQYYSIAPNLVNLLESDINRNHLFNEIFLKINRACAAIEKRKFENAKKIYSDAVVNLLRYFKNAS